MPETLDLNGDGRVTLDEIIKGAMWVVFWIVVAVNVAYWCVLLVALILFGWEDWEWALRGSVVVFCLSLMAGVGYAAQLGISRAKLPEWQKKQVDADIAHARKVAEFEYNVLSGANQQADETAGNAAMQEHYARLFLRMSYDLGKFVTRKEWTDKGLGEDWWNRINRLMLKYGIRQGKSTTLLYRTFAEAWGAWCDAMLKTRRWVRSGDELLPD